MTQSLIVFAALQVASLAIILAFTALESLRSGTERFRGERPAKAKTGLARGARRKQRHGGKPPRGLTWLREAAAAARRRAVSDQSHRRSSTIRGGLDAERDDHNANPCALRAT
jgi:hypothetical protein